MTSLAFVKPPLYPSPSSKITPSFSPAVGGPYAPPPMDSMGPPPEQYDNIVNRKGGVDSSLYQSCLALRRRLMKVPGFEPYLKDMDLEEQESSEETDPVTSMWNMLRRGYPLVDVYNTLSPNAILDEDIMKVAESKRGKAATFKFLQACMNDQGFPSSDCFLITDLYGSDTTGFVKVLKVINRVLDILNQRGLLLDGQNDNARANQVAPQQRTRRELVIEELVTTERDYVQHLDTLQQFKNQLDNRGVIPGDILHGIFMNLNVLLDFQRRFLIRIEQQNSLELPMQNWGQLFTQYQDGFQVYEPFIANQSHCNELVLKEWEKIKAATVSPAFKGMVSAQTVLTGFLLKPFQRLTKYPLLLDELRKSGDYDEDKIRDLEEGSKATKFVLDRANAAIDQVALDEELRELLASVDDWKGHKIEHFGGLVICGAHTVLKGEGQKEVERDYKVYLFERILLCCKEINPNKPKQRLASSKNADKKGKQPRLQLKGRIFMQNVTDVVAFAGKNNSHHLQIFWKGDPGVENFVIRFLTAEIREKWRNLVEKQIRALTHRNSTPSQSSTSKYEFTSMSGVILQSPYTQDPEDDMDDDDDIQTPVGSTPATSSGDLSSSRNASSTSLSRIRSATGGSGHSIPGPGRVAPPRFPMQEPGHNGPPLKLSTSGTGFNQMHSAATPDERMANSYFSPTAESPSSMRSSSQASVYSFGRQHTPSNGWHEDRNKHNTAPPMSRGPLREDDSPTGYGRPIHRPSLPPSSHSQQQMVANRSRSVSSPDVQNNSPAKRYPNGQMQPGMDDVPVPPIPPHMASMRAPVNRSQNNSPTDSLRRVQTQSPNLSRAPHSYANHFNQDPRYQSFQSGLPSNPAQRIMSPPVGAQSESPFVSQLRVKIYYKSPADVKECHVTIVVGANIKYRSLIDRIDSKMDKNSACSIARSTARLRYKDPDDEMITISNDEDVQLAIEEWAAKHDDELRQNMIPDFDLFWVEVPNGTARYRE